MTDNTIEFPERRKVSSSCPLCGCSDTGYVLEDWNEPVWFVCRQCEVRWPYAACASDEEFGFVPAWTIAACEAIVPEVMGYRVIDPPGLGCGVT